MPARRKTTRRKGESLKSLAVKIDKLQHPRSQWAKAWVRKEYMAAPDGGPGPGRVRSYPANYVVGSGMYTGKGGFWSDAWNATKGVRGAIGGWARQQGGVTGALGQLSGALGLGDYTTNAIVNGGMGAPEAVPSFAPNMGSAVTISHKEYVSDIYGTATGQTFQNSAYAINPALSETFPWLAQIASNYDEYTIKQLIFTFRSSIAPIGASSSGQVGTVIMATQYNAGEEPFTDKETMMQYDGAMSAKVIDGLISGVECDPAQSSGSFGKFTRSGPPPAGQDIKTYDLGTFNVAVTNIPTAYNNQSLGELWVSYTIELRKPKFFASRGFGIPRDTFVFTESMDFSQPFTPAVTTGTFPSAAIVVSATPAGYLQGQQNNIGAMPFSVGSPTADTLWAGALFPAAYAGNVAVTFRCVSALGQAASASPPTVSLNGNIELIKDVFTKSASTPYWVSTVGQIGYATSPEGNVGNWEYSVTLHLRVAIATNGIDNFFSMSNTFPGGTSTAYGAWKCTTCDIREYNTSFNYKQDGTNDQLVLQNSGGQIVVP